MSVVQKTQENQGRIKANTSIITSNLGGGAHGHLGLVLTNAEYALVSAIPYVRPVHPGPLVLPAGAGVTNLQQEIARDQHKEAMRVYREVIDLEKALLKQLVQALSEIYVKSFHNCHSMAIFQPISTVLTTLFTTYGDVQDEEVQDIIDKLKARVFDIFEPLVGMFDEIEDLKELSIAAKNELTERQLVPLGVQLIKNTNDFERGLETWVNIPVLARTWLNFKAHFTNAQTQLHCL